MLFLLQLQDPHLQALVLLQEDHVSTLNTPNITVGIGVVLETASDYKYHKQNNLK